jgi:regulator of nucleoside diphosphate kinase
MREETVSEERVRLTDIDTRRLQSLVEGFRPVDLRDAASLALLERHVEQAEVLPARRIDPDIVTMDSEVLVRDLDTHEAIAFRVVFPRMADAAARRISVLAPLGMAVLGRHSGDHVTWQTPGGSRRLRVDRVLYQPEREGRDIA